MIPFFPLAVTRFSFPFRQQFLVLWLLLALPVLTFGQTAKYTISGFVRDKETGENLIGVSIYNPASGQGTATNAYGFYSLTLPQDSVTLVVSYVGYERLSYNTYLSSNREQNFNLVASNKLKTVEIVGTREEEIRESTRMSTISVPIAQIKTLPALFGEVDVLKTLQLLPGVQSGGEGSTGLYVRGGSPDQNLILLDGTPVYNASHLFGFFSVFNPDAVQDVTFYRGAIPAQLGGRLSAILDVRQKEGSYQKFQGTGGIGIVTGRLALEGPIVKDKVSFLVAGRSTYSNWIFKRLPDAALRDDKASFYDGTVKLSALLSDKSKLVFSGYRSHDSFQFSADTVYSWETTNGSLSFNHIFSDNIILDVVGTTGVYDLNLDYKKPGSEAAYASGINHKGLKANLSVKRNKQQLNFGAATTYYKLNPGKLEPTSEISGVNPKILNQDKAIESALYVNNDIAFSNRFSNTCRANLKTLIP